MAGKKIFPKDKIVSAPDDKQLFRLMFEGHSAIMLLIEPQTGDILDANQAAVDFYGYSKSKLCSMVIYEINTLSPELQALERQKALHEERNYFIFPHRLASGEERIVEVHSSPIALQSKMVLFSVIHDITERKQVEASNAMLALRNQTLLQTASDGIHILNEQGYIIEANTAFCNMLGYTREELLQMNVVDWDAQWPGKELLIKIVELIVRPAVFETQHRRKDGAIRDVEINGVGVILNGRNYLYAAARDITERKRAAGTLKESELKLRAILDNSRDAVGVHINGIWEMCNPAAVQLFGVSSPEELIGTSILQVIAPGERGRIRDFVQSRMEGAGAALAYVTRGLRVNGTEFDMDVTLSSYMLENKLHVLVILRDITERKRIEDALRWNQSLLQLMSNSSPLGFLVVDNRTDDILYFNQRFCEIWGIQHLSDRMQRRELKNNDIIPDCLPVLVDVPAFAESCKPLQDETNRIVVQDEIAFTENRTIHRFSTQIRGEQDEYYGRFYIFEDISERKQAEERLREQKEYFSVLHQITLDLLDHRDMDILLQKIVDRAVVLLDAPFGELMLEKDGEMIVQTCTQNQSSLKGSRSRRQDATLSWSAFDKKIPAVLDDYSNYQFQRNIYSEYGLHAVADFPVLVRDKCIGVLALGRSQPGYVFSEIQIKNGVLFAQLVALVLDNAQLFSAAEREIVERKQIEAELRHAKETLDVAHRELVESYAREQKLARTDTLTGINNRRSLFELAEREFIVAMRYRSPLSALIFDIDHFKEINDTYGHLIGDLVLKHVAQTVCSKLRSADVIGRYGGDEFIVLLPHTSAKDVLPLAERIHSSIASISLDTDMGPLTLTVSIGIAQTLHHKAHPDTIENLLARADKSLYAAKLAGRNHTMIFEQHDE